MKRASVLDELVLGFAVALALLLSTSCTAEGDGPEPDAEVVAADAGAPDGAVDECGDGRGIAGRACCWRASPAPSNFCLTDDLVCDPVSVVCIPRGFEHP